MSDPFLRPTGAIAPAEIRAAIASLAGPLLVTSSSHRRVVIPVGATQPAAISINRTRDAILYVEVRIIPGEPGATLLFGDTTNLQPGSQPAFLFPTESPAKFLVYPGKSIFSRAIGNVAVGTTVTEVRV